MKRISIFLVLISLFLIPASAQDGEGGLFAAPFLLQDFGARAAAMGGAATGGPDAQDALHYNPAALAVSRKKILSLQHIESAIGDNFEQLGYIHPIGDRWGVGLSANFVYFTDAVRTEFETLESFTNYDLAVGLSLGYRLTDRIAVGGTAKYIKERLFNFEATTPAFDVGILYNTPFEGLSIGASRKDMGGGLKFITEEFPIATSTRFGAAFQRPNNPWRFTADLTHVENQNLRIGYGLERSIGPYLILRGGYRHNHDGREAQGFTAGLSAQYEDIAVDYAYVPSQSIFGLGATHRIQSIIRFGAERDPWIQIDTKTAVADRKDKEPLRQSDLQGTITTGIKHIDIDNNEIIGFVPGYTYQTDIFATRSIGEAQGTLGANLYYDDWDHFTPRRIEAELRQKDLRLTIGDFITVLSPYSIHGRSVRGTRAEYTVSRDVKPIAVPAGEELLGLSATPVNLGMHLRETGAGPPIFQSTTVKAITGQTEEAINVGDELKGLNGVNASFGVFEQFTYGAEVQTEALHNTFLTLRAAHVVDDKTSLHSAGVTDPKENTALTFAAEKLLPSGDLSVDGEIAYSIYDDNTFSELIEKQNDAAWFTRMSWQPWDWNVEAVYEYVGPQFELGGNLSMRSLNDRKGPRFKVTAPVKEWVTLRFDGDFYEDNLNQSQNFTTKTFDGGVASDLMLPLDIRLTLGYRTRMDRSDISIDTTSPIQLLNTRNEIYTAAWRIPIKSWSLSGRFSSSISRQKSEFAPGTVIGGFATKTLSLSALGPLWTNASLSLNYLRTQTDFALPESRTVFEQFAGRINVRRILDRFDVFASSRLNLTRSPTQTETRHENGVGLRTTVAGRHTFDMEYTRVTDHFEPLDEDLNFNADVVQLRYTNVF